MNQRQSTHNVKERLHTYKSCNIRFEKLFSWNDNIEFLVYKEIEYIFIMTGRDYECNATALLVIK